ncbi:hypothetical protein V8C42DRAFT_335296 [Trichoderma barbatum]
MDVRQKPTTARKACLRCRRSKRRCDKALPKCLLCRRRQEDCLYETITFSSSASATPPDTNPTVSLDGALSSQRIKAAIVEKLSGIEPKDVGPAYSRTIRFWFPIIAESRLGDHLPADWTAATLDFSLLCLTIILFCTTPKSEHWGDNEVSELKDLYLSAKSWIALVEGMGDNSTEIVLSRLFITAFEVTHGLYPAAYISISAAARAAETLKKEKVSASTSYKPPAEEGRVEECMIWAAIKILDRYIAIESGEYPPVTRRIHKNEPILPYSKLTDAICPAFLSHPFSPQRQFLRLYEATNLLDKVHITIYEPTPRISFNLEEGALLVNTLTSLRTIILGEVPDDSKIYASGLLICNIGLLLIYEKCDNERSFNYNMKEHWITATLPLRRIIEDIHALIQLLGDVDESYLERIPPFVHFLMYKTASILTNRLRDPTSFEKNAQILKSLRDFLSYVHTRWLAAGRYLGLLDEDTSPRIFKALEREQ